MNLYLSEKFSMPDKVVNRYVFYVLNEMTRHTIKHFLCGFQEDCIIKHCFRRELFNESLKKLSSLSYLKKIEIMIIVALRILQICVKHHVNLENYHILIYCNLSQLFYLARTLEKKILVLGHP